MKVRELCNIFFLLNKVSSMFLYECIAILIHKHSFINFIHGDNIQSCPNFIHLLISYGNCYALLSKSTTASHHLQSMMHGTTTQMSMTQDPIFNTYIFLHFEERFRESPGQKTKQFSVQTYNHSKLEQSFKLHFTFYIHYFLVYYLSKKLIRSKF